MATPVITIFVRHSPTCQHKGKGEDYKSCKCRKHLRWSLDGKQYRKSAETRSWSEAETAKLKLITALTTGAIAATVEPEGPKAIMALVETFVDSKKSQGLNPTLVTRYRRELMRLADFMASQGKYLPSQIDASTLYEFRKTWPDIYPAPITQQKAQERIRGFLRFLHDDGRIAKIPPLSAIKVRLTPRMPLDDTQYDSLLAAIPKTFNDPRYPHMAQKVRALVRLMRHSGLAIGDAVTLRRSGLIHDKSSKDYSIVTSRQKTGQHVSVPIPHDVAAELLAVANGNPQYIFWDRRGGQRRTVAKDWQKDMRRLFVAAGLGDFSSHCLRDTFSVDLLSKGVAIEEVSIALGHSNPMTTAKYYAPWVKARQDRLNAIIRPIANPTPPA